MSELLALLKNPHAQEAFKQFKKWRDLGIEADSRPEMNRKQRRALLAKLRKKS